MRTAALFAIAVLFASAVRAAAPKPEDWYTPESYWDVKNSAELYYDYDPNKDPPWQKSLVTLDDEGKIIVAQGMDETIKKNFALKTALEAIQQSLKNTKQIQTLGQNLNDLLMIQGLDIAAADGSHFTIKLGNGSQTIKELINTSSKGGTQVPAKSSQYLADNLTLGWQKLPETVNGQTVYVDKLGLRNSQNPIQDAFDWFSKNGLYVPYVFRGENDTQYTMHWAYYGGWDPSVLGNRAVDIYNVGCTMLSLAGWNSAESNRCAFSMTDMLCGLPEEDTEERKAERNYHYVLTRRLKDGENPELHYVPFGDLLPTGGVGRADECSITAMGGEDTNSLSLVGWSTAPTADVLAELMTVNPADPGDTGIVHHVLARQIDSGNYETNLVYLSLGSLYGVTWATNWTEAVEHVTNTHEIVNWMTNWVYHTQYVTNYEDIVRVTTNAVYHENFITNTWNHENFITNTWNHESFITNTWNHENFITNTWNHENFITNAITQLNTIVNWQVVTNYIVRYMGGATPGAGGGEVAPPPVDPEDDPYSPEYEEDPVDKYILPVKNARIINAMTNRLFSAVDPGGALDFASLYTNDAARAEISGFYLAETNQLPIKAEIAPGIYGVDWVDYPEELVKMTSGNIKQIFRWWQQHSGVTNLLANIITNHEALAEMKTNLWSHVRVDTLLDNQSVWTNGARKIEIKGYETSPLYTVPFANLVKTPDDELVRRMTWEQLPLADSEAWSRYGVASWCTLANDILAVEDEETGHVKGSVKALSLYGFEGANNAAIAYKHYPTSEDPEGSRPQLRWSSPQDDYLPGEDYKYSPISNGMDIKWVPAASAVRVVGTDGSEAVVGVAAQTNTLTFASAADSNVQVGVQGDGDGNVTITIGVYYLNNAGVTPPYVE